MENTNENPMEIDEEKKHEASECLLILLSLALSCMRKLKVYNFEKISYL
jgi:hypothetical protein